jgi:NAD(P)-dependent dehydrogenase (short-subunit alcohol dehydrogenase family)
MPIVVLTACKNSYRCTLLSRNAQSLHSAVSTLPSSHLRPQEQHSYIASSVSSPSFWSTEFPAHYRNANGVGTNIDVLVNCAGITQSSLFVRTNPEEIQQIVDTNLTGMMLGTRFLLNRGYLKRRDEAFDPVIINVASLLGVKDGQGAVAYAASKAGVLGVILCQRESTTDT